MAKLIGFLKIALIVFADFSLICYLTNWQIAAVVCLVMGIYVLVGGQLSLWREGAVNLKNSGNEYERQVVEEALSAVCQRLSESQRNSLRRVRLYLIPTGRSNAYTYSGNAIAVTRGLLRSCDNGSLEAVLSHEIAHCLNLDAEISRLTVANITGLILLISVLGFIASALWWIVFLLLCAFGVCGGIFSLIVFSASKRGVQALFHGAQRLLLFVYQVGMGLVNRHCEYRADKFAVLIGYRAELSYYLQYLSGGDQTGKSMRELLYDSHPSTAKRLQRIAQIAE